MRARSSSPDSPRSAPAKCCSALRGFTNVIWPTSLESALEQTGSEDAGCLVIADDLREEPIDEFLQEARELQRNLPIFVITDPDDVAEAVSAMRHGATAVIEIPPSYAALREEVTPRDAMIASQQLTRGHALTSLDASDIARRNRPD